MFDGRFPVGIKGVARKVGIFGRGGYGKHYGQQAYGKYPALWAMPVAGKSNGSSGNGSQFRKIATHALHTQYHHALDERQNKCECKEFSCTDVK